MTNALSPRDIPERLHSTNAEPRRVRSPFEVKATARGYTIKAGAATRERLHSGITFNRTPRPVKKTETDNGENPVAAIFPSTTPSL